MEEMEPTMLLLGVVVLVGLGEMRHQLWVAMQEMGWLHQFQAFQFFIRAAALVVAQLHKEVLEHKAVQHKEVTDYQTQGQVVVVKVNLAALELSSSSAIKGKR
jgi:tartrate dehydratase beta subunit/fumarate hydratase class I family protein